MSDIFATKWQAIFNHNKLKNFDDFWLLEKDWFEEPNNHRNGWSGVSRLSLSTPDNNDAINVFLKRQQNFITRTLRHPVKGIPTFQKEHENIVRFNQHNIPTLELAYFGNKLANNDRRAILITKELTGYVSLDIASASQQATIFKDKIQKKKLLRKLAQTTQHMHQLHFKHNCFYPKHIFVKLEQNEWLIRFIDLESTKRTVFKRSAIMRDLSSLSRHAHGWTLRDRLYFFKAYVDEKKLSGASKRLWRRIEKKALAKAK